MKFFKLGYQEGHIKLNIIDNCTENLIKTHELESIASPNYCLVFHKSVIISNPS